MEVGRGEKGWWMASIHEHILVEQPTRNRIYSATSYWVNVWRCADVQCMWEHCRTLTDTSNQLALYCEQMECSVSTHDTHVAVMCSDWYTHTVQTALKFSSGVHTCGPHRLGVNTLCSTWSAAVHSTHLCTATSCPIECFSHSVCCVYKFMCFC